MSKLLRATGVALIAVASQAQAAFLDAPVPENAYITRFGLDWAWAAPVAGDGSFVDYAHEGVPGAFTGVDLSYQSQFGWRLATHEELAHAPSAWDFIFVGANVPAALGAVDPVSGALNAAGRAATVSRPGAMACASPYFNDWARTCNWQNGPGSGDANQAPWWEPGQATWHDTLVVRQASVVPEPGAGLLMVLGLGTLGACARRRAQAPT